MPTYGTTPQALISRPPGHALTEDQNQQLIPHLGQQLPNQRCYCRQLTLQLGRNLCNSWPNSLDDAHLSQTFWYMQLASCSYLLAGWHLNWPTSLPIIKNTLMRSTLPFWCHVIKCSWCLASFRQVVIINLPLLIKIGSNIQTLTLNLTVNINWELIKN